MTTDSIKRNRILPVVSLSAEYLAMGFLLRRNILTYKAPQNNEGYDLICIHPNPKVTSKAVRVQVKSRYQTDCNRAFPVKEKSLDAFDYLIAVFLNIGYFYKKKPVQEGRKDFEIYVFPNEFIRNNHNMGDSGWQMVKTRKLDIEQYKNEKGIELIASDLKIDYPER